MAQKANKSKAKPAKKAPAKAAKPAKKPEKEVKKPAAKAAPAKKAPAPAPARVAAPAPAPVAAKPSLKAPPRSGKANQPLLVLANPAKPVGKLGEKRICLSCTAKFYDLNKNPITCPKCGRDHKLEEFLKPKRGRKKTQVIEEVEVEEEVSKVVGVDDDEIEILEDDADLSEELDKEIREEMEVEADDVVGGDKDDTDRVLVDLEEEVDDMIDSGDEEEK